MAFTAVFIGGNKLLIDFMKKWIKEDHSVLGVISDVKEVCDWAAHEQHRVKNIQIICASSDVLKRDFGDKFCRSVKSLNGQPPDYVFSILNDQPIKNELILKLPLRGAINYHEGPLSGPHLRKGVYPTSWAIFEGDSSYAIAWHYMVKEIDEGEPILSLSIALESKDTAHTLSARCLERAKQSFPSELLRSLLMSNDSRTVKMPLQSGDGKEKIHQKQKKFRVNKLAGNGLIDARLPARKILSLHRALSLSQDAPNYLGLTKLLIQNPKSERYCVLYPRFIEISEKFDRPLEYGEIAEINDTELKLKVNDHLIVLSSLLKDNGQQVENVKLFFRKWNLTEGCVVPNLAPEILTFLETGQLAPTQGLDEIYQSEIHFWIPYLRQVMPTNLTFNLRGENDFSEIETKIENMRIENIFDFLKKLLNYFQRINQTEHITVGYTNRRIFEMLNGVQKSFFVNILPFNYSGMTDIQAQIIEIESKRTFLRDMALRYPEFQNALQLEFPIVIFQWDQLDDLKLIKNKMSEAQILIAIVVSENHCAVLCNEAIVHEQERDDFRCFMDCFVDELTGKSQPDQDADGEQKYPPDEILPLEVHKDFKLHFFNSDTPRKPSFLAAKNLHEKANCIASMLIQKKISRETPVIICVPPSTEWLISILGVLRAGAAYVPVSISEDEHFTESDTYNLKQIIINCEATIILSTVPFPPELRSEISSRGVEIVDVKNVMELPIHDKQLVQPRPDQLAYILYTSGMTGIPKGVEVEHRQLAFSTKQREIYYQQAILYKNAGSDFTGNNYHVMTLTGLAFDATTGIVFWALSIGAKLVLLTEVARLSVALQLKCLAQEEITHLVATPTQYGNLLNELQKADNAHFRMLIQAHLKVVIIGGETCSNVLLKRHMDMFPDSSLLSEYGPTECTVWSNVVILHSPNQTAKPLIDNFRTLLGKPISPAVKLVVSDRDGNVLPRGIAGELHIMGPLVARGYRGNPHKTKECFFDKNAVKKYRTGDGVRLTHDGKLLYIGRLDRNEIKILGMRVNLEDIKSRIRAREPDVSDVFLIEKDNILLIFICMAIGKVEDNVLIEKEWYFLEKLAVTHGRIPIDVFIISNEVPQTTNGKISKDKLLAYADRRSRIFQHKDIDILSLKKELLRLWEDAKVQVPGENSDLSTLGIESIQFLTFIKLLGEKYSIKENEKLFILARKKTVARQAQLLSHSRMHGESIKPALLLTGSTGFLGTQLLHDLLLRQDAYRIICLAHDVDAESWRERIKQNFSKMKFTDVSDDLLYKLECVLGDLAKPQLGIASDEQYRYLLRTVSVICHAGAIVNHLAKRDTLESTNVYSMDSLVEFANRGKKEHKRKKICYISTKAMIGNGSSDYVRTKHEAEEKLENAAKVFNLDVAIYHPGWIAPHSEHGTHLNSDKDHFLALYETCIRIGLAPIAEKFMIDMLPVDEVSDYLLSQLQIIKPKMRDGNSSQNGDIPNRSIMWSDIVKSMGILTKLYYEKKIRKTSLTNWKKELEEKFIQGYDLPLKHFRTLYQGNGNGLWNTNTVESSEISKPDNYDCVEHVFRKYFETNHGDFRGLTFLMSCGTHGEIISRLKKFKKDKKSKQELAIQLREIHQSHPKRLDALQLVLRNFCLTAHNKSDIIIELTSSYECSPDLNSAFMTTPLYEAVIYNCNATVEHLLRKGSSVLMTTGDGFTLLTAAAWLNNLSIIRSLIPSLKKLKNSDLENLLMQRTQADETCFQRAVDSDAVEVMEELLELATPRVLEDVYNRANGITLLLCRAALFASEKMLKMLIRAAENKGDCQKLLKMQSPFGRNFIHFIKPNDHGFKQKMIAEHGRIFLSSERSNIRDWLNKYVICYAENEMQFRKQNEESENVDYVQCHKMALEALKNEAIDSDAELFLKLTDPTPDENGCTAFQACIMLGLDLLIQSIINHIKQTPKLANKRIKKLMELKVKGTEQTVLHLAVREHHSYPEWSIRRYIIYPNLKIVRMLIDNGAIVNSCSQFGLSIAYEAIFSGIFIDSNYSNSDTVKQNLFIDDPILLKMLLDNGGDFFCQSDEGHTLLSIACLRNSYKIADFILSEVTKRKPSEKVEYVNHVTKDGKRALDFSVQHGNLLLANLLLNNVADPKRKDPAYKKTVLHRAVERIRGEEDLKMVELLVRRGSDVYELKNFGRRPEDLIPHKESHLKDKLRNILYAPRIRDQMIAHHDIEQPELSEQTREYQVVCMYGGPANGPDAISPLDGFPGYLHMHVLDANFISVSETRESPLEEKKSGTLYQWGIPVAKEIEGDAINRARTKGESAPILYRQPVVTVAEAKKYGDTGLGSAWEKVDGECCGAGEGFIFDDEHFRITKGNRLFAMRPENSYWILQVLNHRYAREILFLSGFVSRNREDLNQKLLGTLGSRNVPYLASFRATFSAKNFFARSNGILPTDLLDEAAKANREKSVFRLDAIGGHVIGDSQEPGDIKTVGHSEASVRLTIRGPVRITEITDIQIGSPFDSSFRPARKKQLVEKATIFLQKLTRDQSVNIGGLISNPKMKYFDVIIMGGGIAGCTTALQLAEQNHAIKIALVEQMSDLLEGTSNRTPGRLGLGFHYLKDAPTALLYLRQTLHFMRKFFPSFIGDSKIIRDIEPMFFLKRARYFIMKDKCLASKIDIINTLTAINDEYRRLVQSDPEYQIFGPPDKFFRYLSIDEYRDVVDSERIAFAFETQECLLNWPSFKVKLFNLLRERNNIIILKNHRVVDVFYDSPFYGVKTENRDQKYCIMSHFLVNATWHNIEKISKMLGVAQQKQVSNRIKALALVSLPKKLAESPCMFFAVGPHCMFSNLGNGTGAITYAPVTNLDVDMNKDPTKRREYENQLEEGLSKEKQKAYCKQIVDGCSKYIPEMRYAEFKAVEIGVVKSVGTVDINDLNSDFHRRRDRGVETKLTRRGYVVNAAMKLSYSQGNAEEVAHLYEKYQKATKIILKSIFLRIIEPQLRKIIPESNREEILLLCLPKTIKNEKIYPVILKRVFSKFYVSYQKILNSRRLILRLLAIITQQHSDDEIINLNKRRNKGENPLVDQIDLILKHEETVLGDGLKEMDPVKAPDEPLRFDPFLKKEIVRPYLFSSRALSCLFFHFDPVRSELPIPGKEKGKNHVFPQCAESAFDHKAPLSLPSATTTAAVGASAPLATDFVVHKQLGWNCFDIATGINDRREIVRFALDNAHDLEFRRLLAPEIRHAAALTAVHLNAREEQSGNATDSNQRILELFQIVDALHDSVEKEHILHEAIRLMSMQHADIPNTLGNLLPPSFHTKEVRKLVNDYDSAHEAMRPALTQCNDQLQLHGEERLSVEGLDQFFETLANQQRYPAVFTLFQMTRESVFVPAESAFINYCECQDVYEQYIRDYYDTNQWFAFQRGLTGEKNHTSMVDIVARYKQTQIIIYQFSGAGDRSPQEIYRTQEDFPMQIHIRYEGNVHFVALAGNPFTNESVSHPGVNEPLVHRFPL